MSAELNKTLQQMLPDELNLLPAPEVRLAYLDARLDELRAEIWKIAIDSEMTAMQIRKDHPDAPVRQKYLNDNIERFQNLILAGIRLTQIRNILAANIATGPQKVPDILPESAGV